MTDYFSNKQITEAYQKMYEAANPDGTIDDKSRYDEILHDCAKQILDQCMLSAVHELETIDYSGDRLATCKIRSFTYDEYHTAIRLGNTAVIIVPHYHFLYDDTTYPLQFALLRSWFRNTEENYEEIVDRIYRELKSDGGLIRIKSYEDLSYYLAKDITIRTPYRKERSKIIIDSRHIHFKPSPSNGKAWREKSAAFRKNLSSPKFPDKQRDDEDKTYNEENYQDH